MLICKSEEGIPTPSYSWEKLDALPKLPHNAMQGITNKLAVGVPFCPTFAGKSHTHSVAQTPNHCHLSCARPELLPPFLTILLRWPCWGWWWMDVVTRTCEFVNELVCVCQQCVSVSEQSDIALWCSFLMLNTNCAHTCHCEICSCVIAATAIHTMTFFCHPAFNIYRNWSCIWFSASERTGVVHSPFFSSCAHCTVK